MEIREECIGSEIRCKAPNGCSMVVVINDNPENFQLYKRLSLDVFKASDSLPNKKTKDISKMGLNELRDYAKPFGITGRSKQSIIDELNKK